MAKFGIAYVSQIQYPGKNSGSGGGLLQKMDRDTQKCAFKCSMAIIDGKEVPVFKNPITDIGKKSKRINEVR